MTGNAVSTVSKKRFYEIQNGLRDLFKDDERVESAIILIKTVLNFDPDVPLYTPEYGKKARDRAKIRALKNGTTLYDETGQRRFCQRQKSLIEDQRHYYEKKQLNLNEKLLLILPSN